MNINHNSDSSLEFNTEDELYSALKDNNKSVIDNFIKHGFNLEHHIKGGWTLLMHACSLGRPEMVEHLLNLGADYKTSDFRFTPLMAVCKSSNFNQDDLLKCVDLLLKYEIDINAADKYGQTALMYAVDEGHMQIVERLLAQKCHVNVQDYKGHSAVFVGVLKGREDMVKKLIDNGARLDLIDCDENSAYDVAVMKGFHEIAKLVCTNEYANTTIDETNINFSYKQEPIDKVINQLPSRNGHLDHSGFPSDVQTLLSGMDLLKYRNCFIKHNIQLGEFLTITDERLKEIGVKFSVHRQHILFCIQKFHAKPWNKMSLGYKAPNVPITLDDCIILLANIVKHLHVLKATVESMRHEVKKPIDLKIYENVEQCSEELKKVDIEIRRINSFAVSVENKEKVECADLIKPKVSDSKFKKVISISVLTAFVVSGILWKNQRHLSLFRVRLF